ncbi:TraR/DksA C4-type zinc finger protein [Cupriavidus sp. WKF15]|uniref:TraR/DksA C4-type zinc finger protein n=1 Tax=Cupriavidus sp. WKF15 TaxID=3032282 RepID=UPI0023E0DF5E|nr:TraR/DksA C4-type zinc finger protein [Cupriavidus sp. WKF15]WER44694.1 TraR/DksA C4-type zinc finger protein [Cupriavidus sp. WKF15]
MAPYLPYMRQDKVFSPGEIVSPHHFAALLSDQFDWLVTVDPHLNRIANLSDIFSIPAVAVHAQGERFMQTLTRRELAALVAQLEADEARIRAAVGAADTPLASPKQPEAQDQVDHADDEAMQQQDDAMLNHYRAELADIQAARVRMKDGQYGICTECQQAIPYSRLQAYPTANRCMACQRRHERPFARV